MEPLIVAARLRGRVILPMTGYVHLDALLAWAVCYVECRPPALDEDQLRPVKIPVERSACGRYHLCSASVSKLRQRELRWINKRFPIEWWQALGAGRSAKRVQINAGPSKGFRVPVEAVHLKGDALLWWCVGERGAIERLLEVVTHVGRRRAVGEGEVVEWHVAECEPWGDGFPVLGSDGEALRHLPPGVEGLGQHVLRIGTLTYPYWLRSAEELIVAPSR